MTDYTIEGLSAIADANIDRTMLLEVQRAGVTPTEKMTDLQFLRNSVNPEFRYVAGEIYHPRGGGKLKVNSSAGANGSFYAVLGFVEDKITIDTLYARTGGTTTASAKAQFAVASVDPATMEPKTKLAETASTIDVAAASTNITAALGASVALDRGWYAWITSSDLNTTWNGPEDGNTMLNGHVLGGTAVGHIFGASGLCTGWEVTGQTFGTIPSDLTALAWAKHTSARAGSLGFKVATVH